jgi:hypothetical protein
MELAVPVLATLLPPANGSPPWPPPCWLLCVGVELAELVDELVSALVAELVIGVVGAMTVVEAAPVGCGAATGVRVVSVALEAELVLFVDVLVTCTPGLAVGNVKTSAEEVLSWCE